MIQHLSNNEHLERYRSKKGDTNGSSKQKNETRNQTSLLDLTKEKPINKITIAELSQQADIGRGTFYTHYEDIYDLRSKKSLKNRFVH